MTPDDPVVISYILMGNCSKWLTHAFNFCTKSWNFPATSKSGTGSVSESEKKNGECLHFEHCMKKKIHTDRFGTSKEDMEESP